MSRWKQAIVRPFLTGFSSRVVFGDTLKALEARALPADARIVIWGIKGLAPAQTLAKAKGVPLWRMEDGFLRSVGLGSDLFRPVSLVVDKGGMYYDPASGSSLEQILATQNLAEADLLRAVESTAQQTFDQVTRIRTLVEQVREQVQLQAPAIYSRPDRSHFPPPIH